MPRSERPNQRLREPQRVNELVPQVLDEIGLGAASSAARLLRVWDAALGEGFARHCRPDGIRNGVLYALVRDSGWMQRIQLEKPRILARIEEAVGEPLARDLRLRIGPLEES